MFKKLSFSLVSILILTQMLFSIQKLEFSKKRNFQFGDGEYGKVQLELKNYETYEYQSEIKKPFVLKKNNAGNIELIYDIRLVNDEDKEIDKLYKTSFTFVKKNIGKTEKIYLSAKYLPEIQIVENDTLFSTYTAVNLSPDKPSQIVYLNSIKDYSGKFNADYDSELIGILSDTDLKFKKGTNTLEISLVRSENFEKEISLYRAVGKSKINQLFITVKSSGFETGAALADKTEDPDDSSEVALTDDSGYDSDEFIVSEADGLTEESSSGMGIISIIIIAVMALVILILLGLLFIGKKGGLYEKYETFFLDIASIVNVEAKGNNIDKVIEEIMMVLLDKFETPYGKEEVSEKKAVKPEVQTKTLKTKPVTTPEPEVQEPLDDLDLDFGNSEKEPEEILIEEPENKPLQKKQLLKSGFDFSELNTEGDDIEEDTKIDLD
ncbi:MAG: hypothetical protein JXR69_07280 [Candidatus Delongbacteria bacterium]|nr:hypothetical protein [Candidatus Delongbacteria bacterium]